MLSSEDEFELDLTWFGLCDSGAVNPTSLDAPPTSPADFGSTSVLIATDWFEEPVPSFLVTDPAATVADEVETTDEDGVVDEIEDFVGAGSGGGAITPDRVSSSVEGSG